MRISRSVVLCVVLLAVLVSLPARGGTAALTGEALALTQECDPYCGGEIPYIHLSKLTYVAGTASANVVTFEYVQGNRESVCVGFGPGSCAAPASADEFIFTEANATLTASGLCHAVGASVGECSTPHRQGGLEIFPPNAVAMLPVDVSLGEQNDTFTTIVSDVQQEFGLNVSLGIGRDRAFVIDRTSTTLGGTDRISCGPGLDVVVTTAQTVVANDCENVTRIA